MQQLVAPTDMALMGRPKVQAGQRNDALAELSALLGSLRSQHRTNNTALAERTGFRRQQISRAILGKEIPSSELTDALDVALRAGGHIRRLREAAVREKRARELGFDPRAQEDSVDTTRRQAFGLAAAGLVAAETYREWSTTGPDVLTLDQIDDAIHDHAVEFTTTQHHRLAPKVWHTWQSAHELLRNGGRVRSQARLTAAAGYASYMLSRLAFNVGDTATSRTFVRLAEDHAEEAGDPVLSASVGEMVSTLAFYGRRYRTAATAAQRTAATADDDYTRARTASYEARALAALGDVEGARAALNRMRAAVNDLPLQPGSSPFTATTAAMFEAGVLARIGAGIEAEPIAREAVATYDAGRGGGFEDHGHALLSLAAALTARPNPVVDEAAELAGRVVGMLDTTPTSSVSAKIPEIATAFHAHPAVAPVRDFWDRWDARPRLELTAGQA